LKIEQLLDRRLLGVEDLNLKLFEEAKAFEDTVAKEIQEVYSQAKAESQLEESLKKVENTWKVQELVLAPHRDSHDMFVLAGIDELQSTYDDSCIAINNIGASRYVGTLKPRVEEWDRLLKLFGKVLDEWLSCQKKWIYLEAIFSAPDIQRQLPTEAKLFNIADKWYRNLMRSTSKVPLALTTMTSEKLLEEFKQNIGLLEQVSRCLEMYLEAKRVSFPRFYFLSNNEMLEIFVQTKNVHAVQPYLRKCFEGISKIEFGSKRDQNQQIVLTNDIVAMFSAEGERVAFARV
jgi:dynein heavy chain